MSIELDLDDLERDLDGLVELDYLDSPIMNSESAAKPKWASHGCGARWRNNERGGHCGACHVTFTADSGFEAHRYGPYDKGRRCRTIDEMVAMGFTSSDGELHDGKPTETLWSMAAPAESPWGRAAK